MSNSLRNFHVLTVKFLGATDNSGSRVKIISERFKDSVTFGYDYKYDNTMEMAADWLWVHGYELIGKGESKDGYYIISTTFEPLAEMKKRKTITA